MTTLNLHYAYPLDPEFHDFIKTKLASNVNFTAGKEQMGDDYHILASGSFTQEELERSPNLKSVIIPWAGLPKEAKEHLPNFPHLTLHNLHWNARPVAEYAIGLLLAASKALIKADQHLRRGDWHFRFEPSPNLLLGGKTVVVLGYGAIGRICANLARGLGMNPIGIRRTAAPGEHDDGIPIIAIDQLHTILPKADVLMLALPSTAQTKGIIGEAEIALLPSQPMVVNVGRGDCIDEEALFNALKSRRIHAAGLDVWFNYPPDKEARDFTWPSQFPFQELENVVMSSHRSAGLANDDSKRLRLTALAELVNHAAADNPMPNVVSLERGY